MNQRTASGAILIDDRLRIDGVLLGIRHLFDAAGRPVARLSAVIQSSRRLTTSPAEPAPSRAL
jgi:hypothetical protein